VEQKLGALQQQYLFQLISYSCKTVCQQQ